METNGSPLAACVGGARIYLQPNGKYAVRVVIDGRARLRDRGDDTGGTRAAQRLLLAEAARRGELPVFPRLDLR